MGRGRRSRGGRFKIACKLCASAKRTIRYWPGTSSRTSFVTLSSDDWSRMIISASSGGTVHSRLATQARIRSGWSLVGITIATREGTVTENVKLRKLKYDLSSNSAARPIRGEVALECPARHRVDLAFLLMAEAARVSAPAIENLGHMRDVAAGFNQPQAKVDVLRNRHLFIQPTDLTDDLRPRCYQMHEVRVAKVIVVGK